jgi:sulfur carrier protein
MAKIQLNGKKITIKSKETIYDLLKRLKLNNKKIAIEHNGIIIPEVNYKKKYLKGKDKLEVVHFIGGG